jgi:hypothetical protein
MRKAKRFLSLILCILMTLTLSPVTALAANEAAAAQTSGAAFADVPATDQLYPYVRYLTVQGIMEGFDDGTFRPSGTLTRAEAAKAAVLAKGLTPVSGGGQTFTDVPAGHSAFAYIEAAAKAGLAKGYPDGSFKPDAPVSRAEATALLLNLSGGALSDKTLPVADVAPGNWAYKPAVTAVEAGLLALSADQLFYPDTAFSRGEFARTLTTIFALGPNLRTAALTGKLTVTKGQAAVSDGNGTITVKAGSTVTAAAGMTITVGNQSRAEISFDDGSGIRIEPGAEIAITRADGLNYMRPDGTPGVAVDNLVINQVKGQIFGALANRNEGSELKSTTSAAVQENLDWWLYPYSERVRITVNMPWSVAEVWGTFWGSIVNPGSGSSTEVLDGSATVSGGSGTPPPTPGAPPTQSGESGVSVLIGNATVTSGGESVSLTGGQGTSVPPAPPTPGAPPTTPGVPPATQDGGQTPSAPGGSDGGGSTPPATGGDQTPGQTPPTTPGQTPSAPDGAPVQQSDGQPPVIVPQGGQTPPTVGTHPFGSPPTPPSPLTPQQQQEFAGVSEWVLQQAQQIQQNAPTPLPPPLPPADPGAGPQQPPQTPPQTPGTVVTVLQQALEQAGASPLPPTIHSGSGSGGDGNPPELTQPTITVTTSGSIYLLDGYSGSDVNCTFGGNPAPTAYGISPSAVNTANATFSGITLTVPVGLEVGSYEVTLYATNTQGTTTRTVPVIVGTLPIVEGSDTLCLTEGYESTGQEYAFEGYPEPTAFGINWGTEDPREELSFSGDELTIAEGLPADTYNFELNATNAFGTGSLPVTLTVGAPPTISGPAIINLMADASNFDPDIDATLAEFTQAYTFGGYPLPEAEDCAILNGDGENTAGAELDGDAVTIPAALQVSTDVPYATYNFTLTAENEFGSASLPVTVNVYHRITFDISADLPYRNGEYCTLVEHTHWGAYSHDIDGRYHYEIASGSLPDGLHLDPDTGVISGTAAQGTYPGIQLTITDSVGNSITTNSFAINVLPPVE